MYRIDFPKCSIGIFSFKYFLFLNSVVIFSQKVVLKTFASSLLADCSEVEAMLKHEIKIKNIHPIRRGNWNLGPMNVQH